MRGIEMRITMNLTLIFFSALILAACAGGRAQIVQRSDQEVAILMSINDNLIVPGDRVGPVFLGMTEADLFKKLGDPSKTVRGDSGEWIWYTWGELQVEVTPSIHKVLVIWAGKSY